MSVAVGVPLLFWSVSSLGGVAADVSAVNHISSCTPTPIYHHQQHLLTSQTLPCMPQRRCIPIRYPGAAPTPDTTEVMLITSRGGGWVFPKVRRSGLGWRLLLRHNRDSSCRLQHVHADASMTILACMQLAVE